MTTNLDPTARAANIVGSLREYIANQLGSTFSSGAAIDFGGGEPFDDKTYAEWIQVRILDPARPPRMAGPRAPGGVFGRELFHMLNLNIFVRPRKLATPNSLRLQSLRDTVVAYFVPNARIPVRDYQSDTATLGHLMVFELDADRQILDENETELLQWNLLVSLRWSECWVTPEP